MSSGWKDEILLRSKDIKKRRLKTTSLLYRDVRSNEVAWVSDLKTLAESWVEGWVERRVLVTNSNSFQDLPHQIRSSHSSKAVEVISYLNHNRIKRPSLHHDLKSTLSTSTSPSTHHRWHLSPPLHDQRHQRRLRPSTYSYHCPLRLLALRTSVRCRKKPHRSDVVHLFLEATRNLICHHPIKGHALQVGLEFSRNSMHSNPLLPQSLRSSNRYISRITSVDELSLDTSLL